MRAQTMQGHVYLMSTALPMCGTGARPPRGGLFLAAATGERESAVGTVRERHEPWILLYGDAYSYT